MERDRHYQQQAFDLTASPTRDESPNASPMPAASADPERFTSQFPTLIPAGRRRSDDLWEEYRLEVEFRETHGMMPVSLAEFEDMRDWSDHATPQDVAWPALPYTLYERDHDDTDNSGVYPK